jgi:DNA-binding IclR family transcriptional regulator
VARSGSYGLGIRLFELGSIALANMDILREAKPFMDRLSKLSDESSHLGVFNGFEVIVVEREEPGDRSARGLRPSENSPAYCTGVGKALLAFQRPEVIERVIATGLKSYTPNWPPYASGATPSTTKNTRSGCAVSPRRYATRRAMCLRRSASPARPTA